MNPREPGVDPRDVVRAGYDVIADEFLAQVSASRSDAEVQGRVGALIAELRERLPENGDVLDLGCGAGEPFTRLLAQHFNVTGVDFSSRQLELAAQKVPGASFIQADMTEVEFPGGSFDAVTAFTSLMHVPRDYHGQILRNIGVWLRPGGLFLASLGTRGAAEQWEDDWLGAPMFWSHHEPEHVLELVGSAGLAVERDWFETVEDGIDGPEAFFWVLASQPGQ